MKLSVVIIFAVTISIVSVFVFGALWFFDPVNLRIKPAQTVNVEKPFHIYAKENLTWTKAVASAPWEPRDSGEVFLFQNKMWLIGGLNGNKRTNDGRLAQYKAMPHFNDIWNTEDGLNWSLVAVSSAWEGRRSMSVALFQDRLWMLGGWSPVTGYTNDIWTSNDGIHWTKTVENAAFPASEGQVLKVFQNKLWKIGGVNYDKRRANNDVWYSENGVNWTKVKNIPWRPRWDHAVTVFNGKLFLAGGMNLAGKTFNDVWMSEDGMNWTLITNKAPWAPRQGHALKVYRGKLWIIGRLNDAESGGPNDIWSSNDGITWQKNISDPLWTGREDFFSAVFKDRMWIFGGMDSNWQWRNDVWVSEYIMP